jgi:hypothetical protein
MTWGKAGSELRIAHCAWAEGARREAVHQLRFYFQVVAPGRSADLQPALDE